MVAVIYIAINMSVSRLATWLEARSRRSRKTQAKTMGTGGAPPVAGVGAAQQAVPST